MRWLGLTGPEIIAAIAIPAGFVGSVIIYILEGRKKPKLEFDKFFKEDSSFVTTIGVSNRTTFFVKLINTNHKTEGKADECTGILNISGKNHKTIWNNNHRRKYTFATEGILLILY
jgi:hypothetical protein